ncbi:MAG: DUF1404 family protein [Nitrososphaerales archaeon]
MSDGISADSTTELNPPSSDRKGKLKARAFDVLGTYEVLGIILFIFATTFPPLEVTTSVNIGVHMIQHVLITISGVSIGYPIYKSGRVDNYRSARLGVLGFLIVAAILIFWHLPIFWDSAVQSLSVHLAEHLCFLAAGLLIGMTIPMLPDNFKLLLLALAVSAHMFYGFALFVINTPVYPLYPVSQQQVLGVALFAPSPIYFVGYLYFSLTRESRRLDALENHSAQTQTSSKKAWHLVTPALSILLILILIAYFGVTGAVILGSSSNHSPSQTSTVYIDESPLYWQYSPQVIHVVIGVNNTVFWVSHSFTYDTVTGSSGLFDSGAIAPGSSFSYTFTQPGTYNYYCQYHVWMKGTIVVTSA